MEAAEDGALPSAPGEVQDEVVLNFVSPPDSLSNANQPAEPAAAFDQSGDDDHLWASSLGQDRGIFAWRTPATSRANAVGIPLVTDYATSTEDGASIVPSLPFRSHGASASPSSEAVGMMVDGNGDATDEVILQFVSPPSSPINPPARPTPTISHPREDHVIWAPSLGQGRSGIFSWRRSTPSLDLVPRGAGAPPVDSFHQHRRRCHPTPRRRSRSFQSTERHETCRSPEFTGDITFKQSWVHSWSCEQNSITRIHQVCKCFDLASNIHA